MRRSLVPVLLLVGACSGGKFTSKENGKEVEVKLHYRFVVTLEASNDTLHPRYRFARGRPEISGDTVVFVRCDREKPPPAVPGAAGRDHYVFKAVEQGPSTLQFWRTHRNEDGSARREKGYSLTVVVR
jgi:hypothetical protein